MLSNLSCACQKKRSLIKYELAIFRYLPGYFSSGLIGIQPTGDGGKHQPQEAALFCLILGAFFELHLCPLAEKQTKI